MTDALQRRGRVDSAQPGRSFVPDEDSDSLRRSLWFVTVAWLFGATWMYTTMGAALTQYGKLLGVGHFGFGLIAAIPWIGALVQLPASFLVERYGHRKAIFFWTGVTHRACWIIIGLIPWFVPPSFWWLALLTGMLTAAVIGSAGAPAGLALMADLVPNRIRGRYISRRAQVGQLAGAIATVLICYAMDQARLVNSDALRKTISLLFAVAGVSGVLDFMCWRPVRDPGHKPDPNLRIGTLLKHPLQNRNFRRFLGFTFTLTFGTAFVGQFIWLYVLDVAKMSNSQANMLMTVLPLLVTFLAYPIWGRVVDRIGRKPVLIIAGLMIVHGAIPWMFMSHDSWLIPYMATILCTVAWPGVDVATFNLLLGMVTAKGERRLGSSYIAVNSLVAAVSGALSGLAAGGLAEALGTQWVGPSLLGCTMTYHGLLFFISAALRLLSLGWVLGIEEPRALGTRAAIIYITSDIYTRFQQTLFLPVRYIGRLSQWAYRLYPAPKPPPRKL
jgi:MFS family permease